MTAPRLAEQTAFLVEADKLKNVLRHTLVTSGARRENSAEHSWHLALCAIVLAEYAAEPVDPVRTALPALWPTVVAGVEEFFSSQSAPA